MSNERHNRLILDNVPYNINIDDFTNQVNDKVEDKSKQKNEMDLINEEEFKD